jgi:N-acetylmuramoyl-L-alanine amidase
MACYISAGHHKKDPGAVANGLKEADLTVRVRDRVLSYIRAKEYKVVTDDDDETLAEYLKRIKPGEASVVVEFHFDAATNPDATGTSAFYADGGSINHLNSVRFAEDLTAGGAGVMGIRNRGAHSEKESHRGKLALVHEEGINCLVEVCFITNPYDIQKFNENFDELCMEYANIIMRYDDMIK